GADIERGAVLLDGEEMLVADGELDDELSGRSRLARDLLCVEGPRVEVDRRASIAHGEHRRELDHFDHRHGARELGRIPYAQHPATSANPPTMPAGTWYQAE